MAARATAVVVQYLLGYGLAATVSEVGVVGVVVSAADVANCRWTVPR